MWILTKFNRIVRDGKDETKIEAAQAELIESAKAEVEKLVENEIIKEHLSETEVTYDKENSATVHLKKALTKEELSGISGTGIMASIETVFTKNSLSEVTVSIEDAKVTINSVGELSAIKGNILEKLSQGINAETVVTLVAAGPDLGEGVTYTVNFTVTPEED